jgi:putative phosphoesterase
MNVAIFSDIHGNLPNLEKALKFIKNKKNVDFYMFLGDVVGYGPWSNECVEIIENIKNASKILGNHEEYFIKKKCNSANDLTKLFFEHSYKNFKYTKEIKKYKKNVFLNKIRFTHTIKNQYINKDTNLSINENLVIGHSHSQFKKKINKFWLVNPGSLGQNRKDIARMEFAIMNIKNRKVVFISKKSNINFLLNEMKSKRYPSQCIEYYLRRIK